GLTIIAFRSQVREAAVAAAPPPDAPAGEDTDVRSQLQVDAVEVLVGEGLVPSLGKDEGPFLQRVKAFRKQLASDFGLVLPKVKLRDAPRKPVHEYEIRIHG